MEAVTVIDQLEQEMQSDDSRTPDQARRVVEAYKQATPDQRAVVDKIFIAVCGYSMETLIQKSFTEKSNIINACEEERYEHAGERIAAMTHEQRIEFSEWIVDEIDFCNTDEQPERVPALKKAQELLTNLN